MSKRTNLFINGRRYTVYNHINGIKAISIIGMQLDELEMIKKHLENNYNKVNLDNIYAIFFRDCYDGYITFS